MRQKQFADIRRHLGKTQSQMAQVLGVSSKAIQSFEQGWRNTPVHVERQVLLILALDSRDSKKDKPCWIVHDCSTEDRGNCPAWQYDAGNLCRFINGMICEGKPQGSWKKKMKICRECEGLPVHIATEGVSDRSLRHAGVRPSLLLLDESA